MLAITLLTGCFGKKLLPYSATLVPLIFSSDKTCLTNFSGNKQAWPLYLTIGNIPKGTRRRIGSQASVLVGYLPVSKLKGFTSGEARQQAEHWIFHTCMRKMLQDLETAGREGVNIECSDGWVWWCYPVLGAYIADHPEQCMIACCKQNTCWACKVPPNDRGESKLWEARTQREVGAEIIAQALGARHLARTDTNQLDAHLFGIHCPIAIFFLPLFPIFSIRPTKVSSKTIYSNGARIW
jgi:hypothetical protein